MTTWWADETVVNCYSNIAVFLLKYNSYSGRPSVVAASNRLVLIARISMCHRMHVPHACRESSKIMTPKNKWPQHCVNAQGRIDAGEWTLSCVNIQGRIDAKNECTTQSCVNTHSYVNIQGRIDAKEWTGLCEHT